MEMGKTGQSSLFIAIYSILCIYYNLCNYFSANEHLGCFYNFTNINSATVNIYFKIYNYFLSVWLPSPQELSWDTQTHLAQCPPKNFCEYTPSEVLEIACFALHLICLDFF